MKRIIFVLFLVAIFVFQPFNALTQKMPVPKTILTTSEGREIPLEDDDLSGIKKRPLAKTKERLDKKYYEGFFLLYRIKVPEGTHVKGEYTLVRGPLRITIFEISKQFNAVRKVRVVATGFYQKGDKIEFDSVIKKLEENVFFIILVMLVGFILGYVVNEKRKKR